MHAKNAGRLIGPTLTKLTEVVVPSTSNSKTLHSFTISLIAVILAAIIGYFFKYLDSLTRKTRKLSTSSGVAASRNKSTRRMLSPVRARLTINLQTGRKREQTETDMWKIKLTTWCKILVTFENAISKYFRLVLKYKF